MVGHGFVVPKFDAFRQKFGIWDTVCLNWASGLFFETKSECQDYCDIMNKNNKE